MTRRAPAKCEFLLTGCPQAGDEPHDAAGSLREEGRVRTVHSLYVKGCVCAGGLGGLRAEQNVSTEMGSSFIRPQALILHAVIIPQRTIAN